MNVYNLRVIIVCKDQTPDGAADLLDTLLQEFDTAIATQGVSGLDASLATNGSKWHLITRLNQPTEFDYPIEDQLNWITTSVTAGIQIVEKTTQLRG